MLHLHVADDAAVVVRSRTAVDRFRIGHALDGLFAIDRSRRRAADAAVDRRPAEDDDAAPFADGVERIGLRAAEVSFRGEYDRVLRRAVGENFRTAVDDEVVCAGVAENHNAGFDRQIGRSAAGTVGADIDADVHAAAKFVIIAAGKRDVRSFGAGEFADVFAVERAGEACAGRAGRRREQGEGPAGRPVIGFRFIRTECADVIDVVEERSRKRREIERRNVEFVHRRKQHGSERTHADFVVRVGGDRAGRSRGVRRSVGQRRAVEQHRVEGRIDVDPVIGARRVVASGVLPAEAGRAVNDDAVEEAADKAGVDPECVGAGPDQREVGDGRIGRRRDGVAGARHFHAVVAAISALLDHHELGSAAPAIVEVERVVVIAGENHIFQVHRAAEDFDAVVGVIVHLDIFDGGAVADAAEGQAVQFVAVLVQRKAGEADLHVADNAAVVVRSRAAVNRFRIGHALDGLFAAYRSRRRAADATVDRRPSENDDAAPFGNVGATGVVRIGCAPDKIVFTGEHDRAGLRAVSDDLRAAIDDEVVCAGIAENHNARLDRQDGRRAAGSCRAAIDADIDAPLQPVSDADAVAVIIFERQGQVGENGAGDVADDNAADAGPGGETGGASVRRAAAPASSAAASAAARRRSGVRRSRRCDIVALRTGRKSQRRAGEKNGFDFGEAAHLGNPRKEFHAHAVAPRVGAWPALRGRI